MSDQIIFDVATLFANVATVAALFFLLYEIRQSTKSRYLEGAVHLFEYFNTEESKEARRIIYSAGALKHDIEEEERKSAEQIWAYFNQMGILVKEGLLPRKIALEMYSETTIRCWKALEKNIKEERKKRQVPTYMHYFEWLYNESVQYRGKEFRNERIELYTKD